MIDWIIANKQWLFSGIGVLALGGIYRLIKWLNSKDVQLGLNNDASDDSRLLQNKTPTILFVDDKNFKIVNSLRDNGWPNTRRIVDVKNLKSPEVACADILFIDIEGVGRALNFEDQGLGLALAVKKAYPQKKIVIYSANAHGNMFHPALNTVDATLPKNASNYQFQQLVEQFSKELGFK